MSTHSASPAPAIASNSNSSGSIHQNVVPSEVGWQFVPQYYTFVNKQPNRLHCFYTKKSTFIHGTEGEDGRPCHGQQEIHQKILSIGFQDCKVFIHSVDAQASADNGIIIQVIGEMSNRGEPWRKFVQTFFLAEQPNGYYVLNDIFRFLKEESVEDDEAVAGEEPQPEPAPVVPTTTHVEPEPPVTNITVAAPPPAAPAPAPESVSAPAPAPVQEPPREPTPEPEPIRAPEPVEEHPKPQPNGLRHEPKEPEPVVEPAPQEPAREPTPAPALKAPSPVPPAPAAQPSPAPAPQQQQAPPQQQQPQPPQPAQPSAPKTWANLAAADSKKWGSVAQETRGVTVEAAPALPAPSRSGTNTPVSGSGIAGAGAAGPRAAGPGGAGGGQRNAHGGHGGGAQTSQQFQAAMSVTSSHVFVKGLVDPIKNEELEHILAQYGKIKTIDFARGNGCAFVEYEEVKSAQRAIVASLNRGQGGEGGIFYKRQDGGQDMRIIVETKKERGERPPPRGRGGPGGVSVQQQQGQGGNRGGGGNFRGGRGGSGGSGRGRGAPNSAGAGKA